MNYRWMFLLLALCVTSFLAGGVPAAGDGAIIARSGPTRTALLELFTSDERARCRGARRSRGSVTAMVYDHAAILPRLHGQRQLRRLRCHRIGGHDDGDAQQWHRVVARGRPRGLDAHAFASSSSGGRCGFGSWTDKPFSCGREPFL
jgi:hypothetical protein